MTHRRRPMLRKELLRLINRPIVLLFSFSLFGFCFSDPLPLAFEIVFAGLTSHLVPKRRHAALVSFDFPQMEGDVAVELLEELDPIPDQDRQDRITNFVG